MNGLLIGLLVVLSLCSTSVLAVPVPEVVITLLPYHINVAWTVPEPYNFARYKVYRTPGSIPISTTANLVFESTNKTDTSISLGANISPNTQYTITVEAHDTSNENAVNSTTIITPNYQLPGQAVLRLLSAGDTFLNIGLDPATPQGSYNVVRYVYINGVLKWTIVSQHYIELTLSGLESGTNYTLHSKAVDSMGNSSDVYVLVARTIEVYTETPIILYATDTTITVTTQLSERVELSSFANFSTKVSLPVDCPFGTTCLNNFNTLSPMTSYYVRSCRHANCSVTSPHPALASTTGIIRSIAGQTTYDVPSIVDGSRDLAGFRMPTGFSLREDGSAIVIDNGYSQLKFRTVNLAGYVNSWSMNQYSFEANSITQYYGGANLFTSSEGIYFFSDDDFDSLVAKTSGLTVDGNHNIATTKNPGAVAFDPLTNTVFFVEGQTSSEYKVRISDIDGNVTTIAVNLQDPPIGLSRAGVFHGNTFYYTFANQVRCITKISATTWSERLVAGGKSGAVGYSEGFGTNALFNDTYGIAVDSQGILLVADTGNHAIRKINPNSGQTFMFVNGRGGNYFVGGKIATYKFNSPKALIYEPISENVLFTDLNGLRVLYGTKPAAPTYRLLDPINNILCLAWQIYNYWSTRPALTIVSSTLPYNAIIEQHAFTSPSCVTYGASTSYHIKFSFVYANEYGDGTLDVVYPPDVATLAITNGTEKSLTFSFALNNMDGGVKFIINKVDNSPVNNVTVYTNTPTISNLEPLTFYKISTCTTNYSCPKSQYSQPDMFSTSATFASYAGTTQHSNNFNIGDIAVLEDGTVFVVNNNLLFKINVIGDFELIFTDDLPVYSIEVYNFCVYISMPNGISKICDLANFTRILLVANGTNRFDATYDQGNVMKATALHTTFFYMYFFDFDGTATVLRRLSLYQGLVQMVADNLPPGINQDFLFEVQGSIYFTIGNQILKYDDNTAIMWGVTSGSADVDGYGSNVRFSSSIGGLYYDSTLDSMFISSKSRLKRTGPLSVAYARTLVRTIAGGPTVDTFTPGTGSGVKFNGLGRLAKHPVYNLLYATDTLGIRVMYWTVPPAVSVFTAQIEAISRVSVSWKMDYAISFVDYFYITWDRDATYATSIQSTTVYFDEYQLFMPINMSKPIPIKMRIVATNKYGNSDMKEIIVPESYVPGIPTLISRAYNEINIGWEPAPIPYTEYIVNYYIPALSRTFTTIVNNNTIALKDVLYANQAVFVRVSTSHNGVLIDTNPPPISQQVAFITAVKTITLVGDCSDNVVTDGTYNTARLRSATDFIITKNNDILITDYNSLRRVRANRNSVTTINSTSLTGVHTIITHPLSDVNYLVATNQGLYSYSEIDDSIFLMLLSSGVSTDGVLLNGATAFYIKGMVKISSSSILFAEYYSGLYKLRIINFEYNTVTTVWNSTRMPSGFSTPNYHTMRLRTEYQSIWISGNNHIFYFSLDNFEMTLSIQSPDLGVITAFEYEPSSNGIFFGNSANINIKKYLSDYVMDVGENGCEAQTIQQMYLDQKSKVLYSLNANALYITYFAPPPSAVLMSMGTNVEHLTISFKIDCFYKIVDTFMITSTTTIGGISSNYTYTFVPDDTITADGHKVNISMPYGSSLQYYITATNAFGSSTTSPYFTDNNVAARPVLIAITDVEATIRWNISNSFNNFKVQIATNENFFTDILTKFISGGARQLIIGELESNTTYYARVCNSDTSQNCLAPYSPILQFSTLSYYSNCSKHGEFNENKCNCYQGYNGSNCDSCEEFYVINNSGECNRCNNGSIVVNQQCVLCDGGTYANATSNSCEICVDGTISDVGSTKCDFCTNGSIAFDGTECVPCSAGRISVAGTYCDKCPSGTYAVNGTTCITCQIGSISNMGSAECTQCSAGTYVYNTSLCVQCPAGSVSVAGSTACTRCPPGSVPDTMRKNCAVCVIGTISNLDNTDCISCDAGTYYVNSTTCTQCPPGSFSTERSSLNCTSCKEGEYSVNSTSCATCDYGKISQKGSAQCTACTSGTYAYNATYCAVCTQSVDRAECNKCVAGQYAVNATTCVSCAPGTVSEPKSSHCTQCAVGSIAINTTTCVLCPPGSISNDNNTVCYPCPRGTFQNNTNACVLCPQGSVSQRGSLQCTQCPAGTFRYNSTNCVACPDGYISAAGTTGECSPCDTGSIAQNRTKCVACGVGTYQINGLECRECNNGTVAVEGSNQCTICDIGTYVLNKSSCATCAPGTIAPNPRSLTCTTCPLGSVSSNGVSCTRCPAGFYAKNLTNCETCGENSIALPGSSHCTLCSVGFYKLNATVCAPNCGDGNCTGDENCLSCPGDCAAPCNICGDGNCSVAIGETCTTCPQDCKTCVISACPRAHDQECGGHGSCRDSICVCNPGYTGLACNQYNIPVVVITNNTQPTIVIKPNPTQQTSTTSPNSQQNTTASFQLSIKEVYELNAQNEIISSYNFINNSVTFIYEQTESEKYILNTYSATLENNAKISILLYFYNSSTQFVFAGQQVNIEPQSLKITFLVQNWPFASIRNSLGLAFTSKVENSEISGEVKNDDECGDQKIAIQNDAYGNLRSIKLIVDSTVLYGQFLPNALLDSKIRTLTTTYNKEESTIVSVAPYFWDTLELDPNFAILLESSTTTDNCEKHIVDPNTKNFDQGLIAGAVVGSVLGLALIVVIAKFVYPKFHAWWVLRKIDTQNIGVEMDDENDADKAKYNPEYKSPFNNSSLNTA